jgi:hypothetical protein
VCVCLSVCVWWGLGKWVGWGRVVRVSVRALCVRARARVCVCVCVCVCVFTV